MKIRTMILPAMVALSWMALGVGARADLTLNTPAGLNPGDQFRFVFVTDATRDATSTSIGDYNTFVSTDATTEAGGGSNVVKYMGVTLTWSAIASTAAVDAKTNIAQTTTNLYLSDGHLVATSTVTSDPTGLWSTATQALSHPIDEDLKTNNNPVFVWTGTTPAGVANPFTPLGSASPTVGASIDSNHSWTDIGVATDRSLEHLYGISQVLTVPGASAIVPEPSTAVVAVFGAVAFVAYGWSRHRREQRQQAAA
jgi:hypothetical protein